MTDQLFLPRWTNVRDKGVGSKVAINIKWEGLK